MPGNDHLERVSKMLGIASECGKLLVIGAALLFMVGALAAPDWIRERLTRMQVTSIKTPLFDLVVTQVPKANAGTLQVAEALTRLEIAAEQLPADTAAEMRKSLTAAKKALDQQDRAVTVVAGAAGLERQLPSTGWVYVGYMPAGAALVPGDRIDPAGLAYQAGKLNALVLKRDAAVSTNGDDCTRTDLANAPIAGPDARSRQLAIVRAAPEPLSVTRTAECTVRGGGKVVFAEVDVPENRVRFAELAVLQR